MPLSIIIIDLCILSVKWRRARVVECFDLKTNWLLCKTENFTTQLAILLHINFSINLWKFNMESKEILEVYSMAVTYITCLNAGSAWRHLPLSFHASYNLNPTSITTPCGKLHKYITNSLLRLDTHRCFFTLRERALEASSARASKVHTTPLKMTPLYCYSLRTWFNY